jgi:hypothetical protein
MQLTDKHRRFAWIGGALIAIYFVAPWGINLVRQASTPTEPAVAKPSAAHIASVAPAPPPPLPDPVALQLAATTAQFNKLAGDWSGAAILPAHGLCKLSLQIRTIPDKPAAYTGYSSTSCNPYIALTGKPATKQNMAQAAITSMVTTSVIITGAVVNNEIVFHIDRNIGIPPDGCAVTGFTVSPFAEQVAAQWQAGTCQGGQLVLNRASYVR